MADTVTTVGPGKTYASLSLWEAGQQKTISSGNREVAECYSFEDTDAVTIDGWTTAADATIYIYTPTAERHDGKWNDAKYRLVVAGNAIIISESYVKIEGLQIYYNANTNYISGISANGPSDLIVSYCLVKANSSYTYRSFRSIYCMALTGTSYCYNNIIYGGNNDADSIGLVWAAYGGHSTRIYNNTIINYYKGYVGTSDNDNILVNNLFSGCTIPCGSATVSAGSDYNSTDHDSLHYTVTGGGNIHDRVSQTFSFVGAADFHLLGTDAGAKDYGVSDPGSGLFSDDIDGQTRSGTWDIGADEYVAAGGGFVPYPIASRGARGGMLALSGGLQ